MAVSRRPRRTEARLAFEALSIGGGLLSPDWLARIAQLGAGQQAPADYRVPKGLQLRDEIGRYWRIAQAYWAELVAGRTTGGDPRALAERFVLALLRECFGFQSLAPIAPIVHAERSFPIGFAALGVRVPVAIAPLGVSLDTPLAELGDGHRRRSAFGLAQEYLDAADDAQWGLASNGATLRIARDNASLTRPAWIEADLERMFTEERYADFAALWLLAHETRFGAPGRSALEAWRKAGLEEGTRIRGKLEPAFEDALRTLGQGFWSHPDNQQLRAALETGALTRHDLFQQLLRLVYRLIFLLTVEENELLHPPATIDAAKRIYADGYSMKRLRERSVRRAAHDRYGDLWEAVKIVFRGLGLGEPRLGLPALGGLFAAPQCSALDGARLDNRSLLQAVFRLAWLREPSGLVRVNWRDMGPEELGSVYETLLELDLKIEKGGRELKLESATKGNARKTSGSYYTPDSLVRVLLGSALDPVIAETIAQNPRAPVEALLGLAIVDPACGSGHFLLGAAHRLAAHVAQLQAGGTPTRDEYQHALRQVVGRCVFGVDLNPMAVELCKVSLWMEAVEPGLPLTFLDSHIQHGNALLGATPELMAKGLPDAAWEPIEGDDKKTASALKKRNKAERTDTNVSFEFSPIAEGGTIAIASQVQALDAATDAAVTDVARKEATWQALLASQQYRARRLAADAWCAAFVWPKPAKPADGEHDALTTLAPTHQAWERLRHDPQSAPAALVAEVQAIAERYKFFHWHLAFPQVFAKGGFDVVLGNPPWERVKLQEQEFFASRDEQIANASNAAARKRLIAQLPVTNLALWEEWNLARRRAEGESHFIRQSGRYPLCGKGDVNTYAVFAEHDRALLGPRGRAGFIVPPGLATDDTTKAFFQELVAKNALVMLYEFENEEFLFPAIDHRVRFILITVSRERPSSAHGADLSFANRSVEALADPERHFTLTPQDFKLLNPNTRTCPTFRSKRDATINMALYRRAGVLWREDDPEGNPWGIRFMAMLHMANDSELFRTQPELRAAGWQLDGNQYVMEKKRLLPLVEAKMVHHFDHRFGTYEGQTEAQGNQGKLPEFDDDAHADPHKLTLPRYWVPASEVDARLEGRWDREWILGWRDICRSTDRRTVIASLIPRLAVGHKFPLMLPSAPPELGACLYGCLTSFVFDYAARQKVGGTSLTYFIVKQLPTLAPRVFTVQAAWSKSILRDWLLRRVLELTYTAWDLEPFARDVGYEGPPFPWDAERRFALRAELDAAFFHLYGVSRADVDHILGTFPVVKKNDETTYGEYRTKRAILEAYDTLDTATRSGTPYRSPLYPNEAGA